MIRIWNKENNKMRSMKCLIKMFDKECIIHKDCVHQYHILIIKANNKPTKIPEPLVMYWKAT